MNLTINATINLRLSFDDRGDIAVVAVITNTKIMKEFIALFLGLVLMILLCYPGLEHDVVVELPITENKPFGGTLNGEFVGTQICCEYWLNRTNQDSSSTWTIHYSPIGYITGSVYSVQKHK